MQLLKRRDLLISFSLLAADRVSIGTYDFRLDATCIGGITIADVAKALGLELSPALLNDIPLLQNVLQNVGVEALSITLAKSGDKLNFQDWSVALLIDTMTLIPEQFVIRNTRLRAQMRAKGVLSSSGSGELYIKALDTLLKVQYETPQKNIPGLLQVSAPEGLSA